MSYMKNIGYMQKKTKKIISNVFKARKKSALKNIGLSKNLHY